MEILTNNHLEIKYKEDEKSIIAWDFDDKYNLPAFYTLNKRGIKKQWEILKSEFNQNTTFDNAFWLLNNNGAKIHKWLSMD